MAFDLTKHSLFKTLFYFFGLAAIFWGVEIFGPGRDIISIQAGSSEAGMPLGRWIDGVIGGMPVLGVVLSYVLVFVNSFYVTRVVLKNVIYLERTYMPAIIYLLVCSGYYNSFTSFRPLLVALLIIVACEIIFRSYNYKFLATGPYLIVGFLLGSAGAVYAPALCLVMLIPVALIIFRIFDAREWLATLGGWVMPLFFSAYGIWLGGGEFLSIIEDAKAGLLMPGRMPDFAAFSSFEWTFAGSIVILFLLSIIMFFARRREYKLRPVKAYAFLIWMLLIWIAVMVCLPSRSLYQLPILAIPLSVIIPTYFSSRKPNIISNLLYILMIGCAIAMHVLPFFE